MLAPVKLWEALPGSQSLFLQSPIREVCFAGCTSGDQLERRFLARTLSGVFADQTCFVLLSCLLH